MNSIEEKGEIRMGLEIHITLNNLNKVFNLNRNFRDSNEKFNNVES
jgi:hypothetical protein